MPYLSASRRRRALQPKKLIRASGALVLLCYLVFALTALYSPVLHHLLGDWAGLNPRQWRACTDRVVQETKGSFVNALFASPPAADKVPVVQLQVSAERWSGLNHGILLHGLGDFPRKPRIPAYIRYADGKFRRGKVSYRGSNNWHHQAWKPSLKVRHDRNRLQEGYRDHILIAPESPNALRNWLSTELSRRWGMISQREHHVSLVINNRRLGLYTRQWRMNESLLIHHDLLPGPFFRLENDTGPCFRTRPASYTDPKTWEIEGAEPELGQSYLQQLIDVGSIEDVQRRYRTLDDLVDAESTARWLAVRAHAGEVHIDVHNFALWLDTTSGRLVPLVRDANGYGLLVRRGDRPLVHLDQRSVSQGEINPMEEVWLRKPQNLALYLERLNELVVGIGSEERTIALVRETWERVRPTALGDLYASSVMFKHGPARTAFPVTRLDQDVDTLCAYIRARIAWIKQELDYAKVNVVSRDDEGFEVLVRGCAGVIAAGPTGERPLLPSVRRRPLSSTLTAPWAWGFFRLPGQPEAYTFRHRLSKRAVSAAPSSANLDAWRAAAGLPAELFETSTPAPLTLGPGRVVLRETLDLPPGQALTIQPGTQLLLGPGVSIFARGRLRAEGRPEAPITLRPLDPSRGFGVLALFGEETKGSSFAHFDSAGGSVARRLNLRFTGMISVHDCPDIRFESCVFGETLGGDDTLHLVRAKALVRGCRFVDTRSDAVDWDQVEGELADCEFLRSGNDSFDASMSKVLIVRCRFEGAGDKAVSAGEGSQVEVRASTIAGADIGVAAKDRSRVKIADCTFSDCRNAISAYRKKWRWERGGKVQLTRTRFHASRMADIHGDRRSEVQIDVVPSPLRKSGRVVLRAAGSQ